MPKNICTEVVARNLCSGCGVCVAVCPQKTLSIQWNSYGEYIAVDKYGHCVTKCSLCLQVCPFAAAAENEDSIGEKLFSKIPGIQHRSETGYYLQASVGYSAIRNQRLNGSSGGLATWMLETLMRNKLVDHAICVAPNSDKDKLFQFKVCRTPEQVRGCAKSSYYPVELSNVLQQVATEGGRYALVGLPCCIKAVRLAMKRMPVLRRRITHLLGLVCGQQKGKFFSEYVAALKGADPRHLITLRFRAKDPARPASDFGLHYECVNENGYHTEDTVFWTEGLMHAWLAGYFTLNACNYCDDLFAELADAAFMDAWLPKYSGDWRGTSIVLTRTPDMQVLIEKGQNEKELVLEPLVIDKVIASQDGGLAKKRTALSKRLTWAEKHKQAVPAKRVRPVPYGIVDGLSLTIEDAAMAQSKAVFLELKNKGTVTTILFLKKLRMSLVKHRILLKIAYIIDGLIKKF